MKSFVRIFILFILPSVFLLLSLYSRFAIGPYFLGSRYDPSYIYLMNSLNLSRAEGIGVGHIDHPGTTVQSSGALVILIADKFFGGDKDTVSNVFSDPEFFLSTINTVFLLLNSLALFYLGFVSFKKFKNIRTALMLQLMPFFSVSVYVWIINVSPEPLLIFLLIIFVAQLIQAYSMPVNEGKNNFANIIILGLICGLGMATKISFLPMLIIPLIMIRKISLKVLFCFITGLVFLIFVYPAISENSPYRFLNWIRKLVTHSGKYGTGENGFIATYTLPGNIMRIINYETVFVIAYLVMMFTAITFFLKQYRERMKASGYTKLFFAVFIAMTLQLIIVLKHFELHYLIPAYLLIIPGIYLSAMLWSSAFPNINARSKAAVIYSLVGVCMIIQLSLFLKANSFYSEYNKSSIDEIDYISKNYSGISNLCTYGSPGKEFALFLGAASSGKSKKEYYSKINEMYPDNYYYDKWSDIIEIGNTEETASRLAASGKLTFMCNDETILTNFIALIKKNTGSDPAGLKKVYSGSNGVNIYEITYQQK